MNNPSADEKREMNPVIRGVFFLILFVIFTFSAGFIHGYTNNILDNHLPFSVGMVLSYAVAVTLLTGSAWGMFRLIRPIFKPTKRGTAMWKTRTGRVNLMMLGLLLLGAISGIAFSAAGIDIFNPINSNALITPAFAIGSAIVAAIALFAFDNFYRRNVDEMELNAVLEASYWGINFYVFAMPVGGLFWKAGLVAEMPSWPIFWATITIYSIVYLWKKYS